MNHDPNRMTFWFWYGTECIDSVRAPVGTSKETARTLALARHDRIPLCYPTAPFEHRIRLLNAEVRVYPGGT